MNLKRLVSLCAFAALVATLRAEVVVTDVRAFSQSPWPEVLIAYTITGVEARPGRCDLPDHIEITAYDTENGKTYPCTTLTGAATSNGRHVVKWNAKKDGVNFKKDKIQFTVSVVGRRIFDGGENDYCVIDLSAGKDATFYPVYTLAKAPDNGWTDEFKTTKLVLRKVKGCTFRMNSQNEYVRGTPVTLTQDYYLGVFEVTQKQWELVMGTNPAYYRGSMRPVEQVSYEMIRGKTSGNESADSSSFMGRLQTKTGIDFDLPTSAQWECACRAGTEGVYYDTCGLDKLCRYSANLNDGRGGYSDAHTTVGSYRENGWGFYDMYGNVAEWCLDFWWVADPSGGKALVDPAELSGSPSGSRVVRGGDFNDDPSSNERDIVEPSWDAVSKYYYGNGTYYHCIGFRLGCYATTRKED